MISIILTAYKEPKTIQKAIRSFLDNKIKESYEILVLAPDKETLDEAKKIKNKKLKIIQDQGRGKPAALNLAFKKAKGNILILSDGDVYIDEHSLKQMIEMFKDKRVGAVTGRPISLNPRNNMLGFWSHLLTDIADKVRKKMVKEKKVIVCSGYLYAIRSGIIDKIPEESLADDAVISHMIHERGYKTLYSPSSLVYVKYPTNFNDWIKQKKRSAGGYNQLKYFIEEKERMRSFSKESSGIFDVLAYPKTLKEFFYTSALIFSRLYLWALIFIDINLRQKKFEKIWVRVESTK